MENVADYGINKKRWKVRKTYLTKHSFNYLYVPFAIYFPAQFALIHITKYVLANFCYKLYLVVAVSSVYIILAFLWSVYAQFKQIERSFSVIPTHHFSHKADVWSKCLQQFLANTLNKSTPVLHPPS